MKMRVNLVKSSQRWDVASRHCVADFDRMDVKWTASRATAREATAPAITDGWITHGTHASALRSLLDLQMNPFLKNKVKRMRRVEKRVTSGSRTDGSRLCESSHCPRQMLFLQQEKLGGNVNGQYNNKDKRKTKSSSSGLVEKSSLRAVLVKKNTQKHRFPHLCDTAITKSPSLTHQTTKPSAVECQMSADWFPLAEGMFHTTPPDFSSDICW